MAVHTDETWNEHVHCNKRYIKVSVMSLTGRIKSTRSPIRQFLSSEFPNTRTFLAPTRKKVRQTKSIRSAKDVPWDIIGMALDYRIRYYFTVTDPKEFVAYRGAQELTDSHLPSTSSIQLDYRWTGDITDTMSIYDTHTGKTVYNYIPGKNGGWSTGDVSHEVISEAMRLGSKVVSGEHNDSGVTDLPLMSEYHTFFESLDKLTTEHPPTRTRLTQSEEDALNRHCIVLALMEQAARTRRISDNILATSKFKNEPLISVPESHWVDDLRELSYRSYDSLNHLFSLPFVLNPSFDGSRDIGGADADLIVDGTLIDIKTTIKQEIKPEWLWQILGYTLLDYSDSFQINAIGLYMSRQGILCRWNLDDALQGLRSKNPQKINELRCRFKNLVESMSFSKPARMMASKRSRLL